MSYFPPNSNFNGWSLLSSVVASNSPSLSIPLASNFTSYVLYVTALVPSVSGVELWLRMSTDGGVTFLSGADYAWNEKTLSTATNLATAFLALDNKIVLAHTAVSTLGNTGGQVLNGFIYVYNAKQTTLATLVDSQLVHLSSAGTTFGLAARGGLAFNLGAVDALQLLPSGGNFTNGRISIYGVS